MDLIETESANALEINDQNELGYIVYGAFPEENVPTAVFRSKAVAEYLSAILNSSRPPKLVESKNETVLEIDEYLSEIKAGKYPFTVSMYSDGSILFDVDENEPFFISPPSVSVLPPDPPQGIYGTFWAHDRSEANDIADKFRLQMIQEGKL